MKHPIQIYRENHGLTQQQLADSLGCSQPMIALLESWERTVSKDTAETWEKKTGIPRLSLMYPREFPFKPSGGAQRRAS